MLLITYSCCIPVLVAYKKKKRKKASTVWPLLSLFVDTNVKWVTDQHVHTRQKLIARDLCPPGGCGLLFPLEAISSLSSQCPTLSE